MLATVCYGNIELNGRPVIAWAFVPIRGAIRATTIEGRDAVGPHEVALGSVALAALGKHVGDVVHARGTHGPTTYRIVGRVVLPRLGDPQPLADGAVFTRAGFGAIASVNDTGFSRFLVGNYAAGADRAAFARRIHTRVDTADDAGLGEVGGPEVPVEIDRLRHIDWFPPTLAALLAVLGIIAVGHALFTGVRRRRKDLAVLKTLGFERRQVRVTVAWQATTFAILGVVVGVPLGVLIGKIAWRLVADGLGVSTASALPMLAFLVVPAALVAVNLIAFVPANAAARQRPAVALQAE
jgi:predicted lysophospholipase L1 biosynthesis ABC-type transport system permease subunit